MAESKEKHWYQSDLTMLCIAGTALFLLFVWFNPNKEFIEIEVTGRRDHGLISGETLVINCWHIFPGTLEKGRITIRAEGAPISGERTVKHHSFDQWPPNEEYKIVFQFPLRDLETDEPIRLKFSIMASNARDTLYETEWTGNDWSQPLRDVSVR